MDGKINEVGFLPWKHFQSSRTIIQIKGQHQGETGCVQAEHAGCVQSSGILSVGESKAACRDKPTARLPAQSLPQLSCTHDKMQLCSLWATERRREPDFFNASLFASGSSTVRWVRKNAVCIKTPVWMTRVEGKMRPCVPRRPVVSNSLAMPWIAARQAHLSMGFSRQEYWSGLPRPPPRDLPKPGNKPTSTVSPALKMDSLPLSLPGTPYLCVDIFSIYCFNHVYPAHQAPNSSAWFSRPSKCGPMVSTWATPKGEPGCRSTWKRSKMWGQGGYWRCPRWSSRVENCIKEQESGDVAVSNQLTYLHRSPEPRAGNTGGKPKIKRQRMTKTDRAGFSNQASALALILLFSDSMDGIKQTRNSVGVFESEILDVDERI